VSFLRVLFVHLHCDVPLCRSLQKGQFFQLHGAEFLYNAADDDTRWMGEYRQGSAQSVEYADSFVSDTVCVHHGVFLLEYPNWIHT